MILNSRHILFTGIGTSGMLGAYGSRYFTNLDLNAYSLSDPFAPIPPRGLENTLVILLSVSGETDRMIEQLRDFKRYGAKTLSITNDEHSTIARLSDYNISYYMPEVGSPREAHLNLTTQVPVVALAVVLGIGFLLYLPFIRKADQLNYLEETGKTPVEAAEALEAE